VSAPFIIVQDSREQCPFRFSDSVTVHVATLDAGDYSVAGLTASVAIERKSLEDLVGSITAGRERFLACCSRLARLDFAAVVVEASIEDVLAGCYRSRTRPQSVVGTMLAIHADYGVPTIWAGSRSNAANMTERLLVRLWRNAVARGEVAA
jgi:ERCC4-type nuclease